MIVYCYCFVSDDLQYLVNLEVLILSNNQLRVRLFINFIQSIMLRPIGEASKYRKSSIKLRGAYLFFAVRGAYLFFAVRGAYLFFAVLEGGLIERGLIREGAYYKYEAIIYKTVLMHFHGKIYKTKTLLAAV